LMNSTREADPIAIHYSQSSMRTEWMLAQKPKGDAWINRTSSTERRDSEFLRLRESFCRLIEDLGLQYNFVAYGQVEEGELLKHGYRALILPRSSSLSGREADAIRSFVEQGGVLITESEPGIFDEHSRRLPESRLADLFQNSQSGPVSVHSFGRGKAIRLNVDVLNYHQNRLLGKEGEVYQLMGNVLMDNGIRTAFRVVDETGQPVVGVETHRFRNGGMTIIGLLSNPQLRVNELGPPEFKSNERFEKPCSVRLILPGELYAYDIRNGKVLGKRKEIPVTLDPYEPMVFAFSPTPVPELRLAAPSQIARGATGQLGLSFDGESPAAVHVLHLDIINPEGKTVAYYSGNVLASSGRAAKLLRLAGNDTPGKWTVRVKDLLSGQERTAAVQLQ
jgi:hypothetical protein